LTVRWRGDVRLAAILLAWVWFCAPSAIAADDGYAVIPAGQEEIIADALGRGAELPGSCSFTGGSIDRSVVRATYTCAAGQLVVELHHPTAAPSAATHTARFAISVSSGAAPGGFIDALAQRLRAREADFRWQEIPRRSWLDVVLLSSFIGFPLITAGLAAIIAVRGVRQRRRHPDEAEQSTGVALSMIRGVGLVIIAIGSYRAATAGVPELEVELAVFSAAAAFLLVSFLWLTLTGCFGYGSARRSDWVGLVPFAIALVLREIFTLHSLQEIEIQFAHGPVGRHSVVYPLLQMFFAPFVGDDQAFTMHMNGWLGALAVLALYLFVRQRIGSRRAGFLCAFFLATSPLVTRFSPTDGPYALLLATWFSGLALLSAPALTARALIAGATLLGIAATARMEGLVFLVASLLMLDLQPLLKAVNRERWVAALSLSIVAMLGAVQMYFLLPFHLKNGPLLIVRNIVGEVLSPITYNGPLFTALVGLGALSSLVARHRLGVLAFLAMLIVIAPVANSSHSIVALHRLVPAVALQALLAGIGAHALIACIPATGRRRWLAIVPGILAALHPLILHRGDLTRPYVFTEEYDLVRRRLAPNGVPMSECTLLAFNSNVACDADIHDFTAVVPGMKVLDCRQNDCLAALGRGGCFYYVRSVACYYHEENIPPGCSHGVTDGGDRLACLSPPIAAFEREVHLTPVEVRMIDVATTFAEIGERYPRTAEIGVFRADLRKEGD